MKFCYFDESGTGHEPFAVMVGVIVDTQRMHLTKTDWSELLETFSKIIGKKVDELHTREFYRGNGICRNSNTGPIRAKIILAILEWLKKRKHKITFSAVEKSVFNKDLKSDEKLKEIGSLWSYMAYHQALSIQKHQQNEEKTKGHTVLVFDREVKEEAKFSALIFNPPPWTDSYYTKHKNQDRLDQIVDVPYFADSKHVHLLQVADLLSYFIRLYLEIVNNYKKESYVGELDFLENVIEIVKTLSLPKRTRYLSTKQCDCSVLFTKYAPNQIKKI